MKHPLPGLLLIAVCCLSAREGAAQGRIIDMHIDAYTEKVFSTPVVDFRGNSGSSSAELHRRETFAEMDRYHIVKAMVSGSPEAVAEWVAGDSSHRIIRGIYMESPTDYGMDPGKFEALIKGGKIQVFGEVGAYYGGTTLGDPVWQPYLRLCEKYDIPVAVHTGGADPGRIDTVAPGAKPRLGDPLLVESVLVRYPRLRIYLIHSGERDYERVLRLMAHYPQLYSDLGLLLWGEPVHQQYATAFLKAAKAEGYLDRVMYSTDQMRWPSAIGKALRYFNHLPFLTQQDKEDILYNNAARFLRLGK
jgi:hypothetical protein